MTFECLSCQLLMRKGKTRLYTQLIFSLTLLKYAWVQPYRWDWPVIDDFLAVQLFLNSILYSIIQITIYSRNNWIKNFNILRKLIDIQWFFMFFCFLICFRPSLNMLTKNKNSKIMCYLLSHMYQISLPAFVCTGKKYYLPVVRT